MRVKLCGDLLVEPNSLRQQPSTISSNCSDHHQFRNIQFSELNQIEIPIIGQKVDGLDSGELRGVLGFTLNQAEWSRITKSHLEDLEPYERKKMCSLPKSFTSFSSTEVGDGGLDRNLNRSASNSILLRKCESISPVPSQFLLNGVEPNNNNVAHPSSLNKILLLRKSHEGFQEDEKENWLSDEGWNKSDLPSSEDTNFDSNTTATSTGVFDKEGPFLCDIGYPAGHNDRTVGEVEVEFLPMSRFPFTHSSTAVGTIGSHPNPIISCTEDQAHHHHHQDLSSSQQASFPATIYNFNSIDPLMYSEFYDEWNANVASLFENNSHSTPVVYQEVHSAKSNGFTMPSKASLVDPGCEAFAAFGECNEGSVAPGKDAEEVNPLSTFLSKFDDKVAAIWGHQGSTRSAIGSNFLSVDGCISSTSTPLGSSNPWGSPSSDISSAHVSDFRNLQPQQQPGSHVSLAADALLSAGYGLQHEGYSYEQQGKAEISTGRMNMCDLTISPPKGNYNIMHSMKQYFGTAPPEGEYYIIKRDEASSTMEELSRSLAVVNHDPESSDFVVVNPEKSENDKQTVIDLNAMAKALDSIDLDNEVEDEWEIVEACNKGRQGYEGEDLLNSWKTHFRTVEQVESIASARGIDLLESPITAISAHHINPNLPEYRLYDAEVDGEYRVFHRPGRTLFPIKYKVFHQNDKSNQTEDLGVEVTSPEEASRIMHAFKMATDWSKYLPAPTFEFTGESVSTLPSSATPVVSYDCDTTTELQSSEWCNMSKGAEYNGMWGDWAVVGDDTSNSLLPGPAPAGEYCDSGVDGVGSRSDYYDDMFGDYDGEYENFSGIGFTFTGITNANDTDYGQFQDATSLSGCDSSSTSGKQAKNCKKSKTRLRPCKYFFLEGSCRRGNDCKFSHDSITCRYWAEGSCLKGQNCPYVHCFIDGKKILNHDEEYGLANIETEKQYHLESETDFPALCSTKASMLSSRQPVALGFESSGSDGTRRLEDSLESLTVFTDSNSSVVEEELNDPRRLLLLERHVASPSNQVASTDEVEITNGYNCDGGGKSHKLSGNHIRTQENREWLDTGGTNRSLSKSKSLSDANSSSWMRHAVSRSNSHSCTSTTGTFSGIPVKEKRRKKKH